MNEIIKDIPINKETGYIVHFGGGCMIGRCDKCKKDFSAEEVDFPGDKEQQKIPRTRIAIAFKSHKCKTV